MFEYRLPHDGVGRLADYLANVQPSLAATEHWRHFASMNRLKCDLMRNLVEVEAGAGFDSRFEQNFRKPSGREWIASILRRGIGRDPVPAYRRAFFACGGTRHDLTEAQVALGLPLTEHKLLSAFYWGKIRSHATRVRSYLEIGAGSGYLAALFRAQVGCKLTIVDLPEMLPFSFLFLASRFPQASFRLPGEPPSAAEFTFLTPDGLDEVADGSIDFSVNTASFGEMLPEQVAGYFRFLRRAGSGGLFLNVNREEKIMRRAGDDSDIPVRYADYPWSERDQDLIHEPSMFHARVQPHNPMRFRLCRLAAD